MAAVSNPDYFAAAERGDIEVIGTMPDMLMNQRVEFNITLISTAAFYNQREIVETLANRGNIPQPDLENAFVYAASNGSLEVIECLLQRVNVNAHIRGCADETALHAACFNGHVNVVSLLVNNGANIDEVIWNGYTPLMTTGSTDVAAVLISHGANVNAISTKDGRTALHVAAMRNNPELVQLLLIHGANPDCVDHGGCKARDFTTCSKCKKMLVLGGVATKAARPRK